MKAIPKPQKIEQDEERLNFVRNMPCLIREYGNYSTVRGIIVHALCSTEWNRVDCRLRNLVPCEAHHVRKGTHAGASRKPPADRTVPLCPAAHSEYHQLGDVKFCAKYGLDLEAHLRRINAEYDALHPKKVTKPVRKRKQKAMLHIQFCAGCSHAHEIPTRKLIQERGILKFRCIQTNQIVEVQ